MRKFLLALVAAGALIGGGNALAADAPIATYDGDGYWGVLTLNAAPGAAFSIRGQRADGTYAPVTSGFVGPAGEIRLSLAETGPGDAYPQFRVMVSTGGSGLVLSVPGIRDWHWD